MDATTVATWMTIFGFCVTLCTLIFSPRGRDFLRKLTRLPKAIRLGMRMNNLGIANFYSCRDEVYRSRGSALFETIKDAESHIGIVAISLQQSITHQRLDKDLERLIRQKPNLTVSISLLSPSSPLIPYLAAASGRHKNDLRDAIFSSITKLQDVQREVNSEKQVRLKLKLCNFHLFNTLVAIDVSDVIDTAPSKGAFFIVEHSLYGISIKDRYTIEVVRPGSRMFEKVLASYRAIMDLEDIAI